MSERAAYTMMCVGGLGLIFIFRGMVWLLKIPYAVCVLLITFFETAIEVLEEQCRCS